MTWITVAEPPFASMDQLDEVLTQLPTAPDGMQARYIGTAGDGSLRIVSFWESQAHADRFATEVLGPVLAKALAPEPAGTPSTTGVAVAREYVRQPVG
jgi:hypothetical protein